MRLFFSDAAEKEAVITSVRVAIKNNAPGGLIAPDLEKALKCVEHTPVAPKKDQEI